MTPDTELKARLDAMREEATDEDLHYEGRFFDDHYRDLTACNHGDTGNYGNRADGEFIAALWNAYRSGQIITRAEADAMVAAEREACAGFIEAIPALEYTDWTGRIVKRRPTKKQIAAAIRARGVKP